MAELELKNISKRLNNALVNSDISFSVEKGQCFCLLGHSGCGKTTLLKIISGLLRPDTGDVIFRNRSIRHIPPHHRNFGLMFQDFALFPHKTVFRNVSFGLEMKKFSKGYTARRVAHMLELVGLDGYAERGVDELSGGERQRVALARTLAPDPDLLMLDEPLGSLDRRLRDRLLDDLAAIVKQLGLTTVFVTHDQHEAFRAADLVCVMDSGTVEQIDSPERIYNRPATRKVADFLGFRNLIRVNRADGDVITTAYGVFSKNAAIERTENFEHILLLPDAASLISEEAFRRRPKDRLAGTLTETAFKGSIQTLVITAPDGAKLRFDIAGRPELPAPGDTLFLGIDPERIRPL